MAKTPFPFKSQLNEDLIYTEIIDYISSASIKTFMREYPTIKFKAKALGGEIDRITVAQVRKVILKTYSSDNRVYMFLLKAWKTTMQTFEKDVAQALADETLDEYLEDLKCAQMLPVCSVLWLMDDEELNQKGDALMEKVIESHKKEKKEPKCVIKQENSRLETMLEMKMGTYFNKLMEVDNELERLRNEIQAKENKIQQLESQLEEYQKQESKLADLKKDTKLISNRLGEIKNSAIQDSKAIEKAVQKVENTLTSVEHTINASVKNCITQQTTDLEKIVNKQMVKLETDIRNSLQLQVERMQKIILTQMGQVVADSIQTQVTETILPMLNQKQEEILEQLEPKLQNISKTTEPKQASLDTTDIPFVLSTPNLKKNTLPNTKSTTTEIPYIPMGNSSVTSMITDDVEKLFNEIKS